MKLLIKLFELLFSLFKIKRTVIHSTQEYCMLLKLSESKNGFRFFRKFSGSTLLILLHFNVENFRFCHFKLFEHPENEWFNDMGFK